jgi:AraC family transcriptional activator of pobA
LAAWRVEQAARPSPSQWTVFGIICAFIGLGRKTRVPARAALVATQLEAALAERACSAARLDGAPCFRAFFVRRGRAVFQPCDGAALLANEDIVWRTIGENSHAAQLRPILDRVLVAAAGLAEVDMLFAASARESHDPGPGAPVMTGLYLGLLLMHLWREGGLARASDALAAGAPTAQRFRQVVELHCHDNLGLDDYAALLGVARAYLRACCARVFVHPPQRLVHERLIAEARVRLRDAAQTAEQIAYGLGFRDPAYFSRSFSRSVGTSPGAYRKASRIAPPQAPTWFSAWP